MASSSSNLIPMVVYRSYSLYHHPGLTPLSAVTQSLLRPMSVERGLNLISPYSQKGAGRPQGFPQQAVPLGLCLVRMRSPLSVAITQSMSNPVKQKYQWKDRSKYCT